MVESTDQIENHRENIVNLRVFGKETQSSKVGVIKGINAQKEKSQLRTELFVAWKANNRWRPMKIMLYAIMVKIKPTISH